MSDKMVAVLDDKAKRALDAAAWIASNTVNGRIELVRCGDELQVTGTDNYVLVCSLVDCNLESWPDGEGVTFFNHNNAAATIGRLLKSVSKYMAEAVVLTVENDEYGAPVLQIEATDVSGFGTEVNLDLVKTCRLDLAKLNNMDECQPEGHVSVSGTMLETIGKLVKKASWYNATWTCHDRGPLHLFDIRRTDGKAYIMAMPVRAE
jgi:hypothetical protein